MAGENSDESIEGFEGKKLGMLNHVNKFEVEVLRQGRYHLRGEGVGTTKGEDRNQTGRWKENRLFIPPRIARRGQTGFCK